MSSANSTKHSFICYLMFILLAAHLNKPGDSQFLEENASPNETNADEPEEPQLNPHPAAARNSQEAPVADVRGEQTQQFHTIPSIFVVRSLAERIRAAEQQIRANWIQIDVVGEGFRAMAETILELAETARRNTSTATANATERIAEEANSLAKVDEAETAIGKVPPKFSEISYPIGGSYYIRCTSPPWYLFADAVKSPPIPIAALLALLGRSMQMQQIPFVVGNSSEIPSVLGLLDVIESVDEAVNSTGRIVYLRSPLLNKYARVVGSERDLLASPKLTFSETAHVNFLGREGKFELLSCVENCTHDFPHTIIRSVATQRFVRASPERELFADEENELAATEFVFEPSAFYMTWRMGLLPAGVYHIRFVVANDSSDEATAVNGTSPNEGYLFEDDTNYLCAAVSGGAARKGLFKLSYNFTDATISLLSANSDVYLGQQLGRDGRDKLVFNQTSSANIAAKFDLQINEVDGSVSLRSVKSWKFISVVPEPKYRTIGTIIGITDDDFDFDEYPGYASHGDSIVITKSDRSGLEKERDQSPSQRKIVELSADGPTKFYFERFA